MKVIFVLIVYVNLAFCQSDDALQLIKTAGYKGAAYRVVTEDGYVLKVHRVKPTNGVSSKPPVFLQHGLFVASSDYLITGKKIALAYLLSDNGYDVWMGNVRGNKYSSKHKTLSTRSTEFWNFSFHEMGYYDMPAMFDLMMNTTGASKAFLVGHSQGTSALMSFLATRPEYVPKVLQIHLLSPALIMKHVPHPLISVLANEARHGFFRDYKFVNIGTIFKVAKDFIRMFCTCSEKNTQDSVALCNSLIFVIVGPNRYGPEIDDVRLKALNVIEHFFMFFFSHTENL
jgi:lysosomal acid lipase/cholesteryl ester hydrolase